MDVGDWLRELGLEQYEAAFRENAVEAEVLPTLTGEELKDIGVSLIRHRRRLLEAIAALRSQVAPTEPVAEVSPSPPADPNEQVGTSETTAERRPLSVMFCDLWLCPRILGSPATCVLLASAQDGMPLI